MLKDDCRKPVMFTPENTSCNANCNGAILHVMSGVTQHISLFNRPFIIIQSNYTSPCKLQFRIHCLVPLFKFVIYMTTYPKSILKKDRRHVRPISGAAESGK